MAGAPDPRQLDDLPPPDTRRWVYRRKAQVVVAVRDGRLTFEEACRRYNLSHDEFASWEKAMRLHGERALRVTRLQDFRAREGERGTAGEQPAGR